MVNKQNESWLRKRFYDFRNGHTIYLAFTLNFIQFAIIFYSLALSKFDSLVKLFPEIWQWVLFFVAVYIPAAVITGHYHMKKQWPEEVKQSTHRNPYTFVTMEGKEQLYNYPVALADFKFKVKAMNQGNSIADAVEEIAKAMHVSIQPIPRFTNTDEVDVISYCAMLAKGLEQGKNILDISKEVEINIPKPKIEEIKEKVN